MVHIERHGDVTRVHLSTGRSRIAGYGVSLFLTRNVLIDSAFPGVRAHVLRLASELRPHGVVLTHYHEDHSGNIAALAGAGLPVHAADDSLSTLVALEPIGLYRRFVWSTPSRLTERPPTFVPEGLELIPSPGHSPDHHLVWDAEHETMFGGDLFLAVKVRVARGGEDPVALISSLRSAAALNPRRYFDSHRGLIDEPVRALNAKADWLEETVSRIGDRIREGASDAAITRELLGPEDWISWVSAGDLSRVNLVTAVRHRLTGG
jgi:glyoxylase-like metal-dependent hydrolase (beta-lactamase superfamily II)